MNTQAKANNRFRDGVNCPYMYIWDVNVSTAVGAPLTYEQYQPEGCPVYYWYKRADLEKKKKPTLDMDGFHDWYEFEHAAMKAVKDKSGAKEDKCIVVTDLNVDMNTREEEPWDEQVQKNVWDKLSKEHQRLYRAKYEYGATPIDESDRNDEKPLPPDVEECKRLMGQSIFFFVGPPPPEDKVFVLNPLISMIASVPTQPATSEPAVHVTTEEDEVSNAVKNTPTIEGLVIEESPAKKMKKLSKKETAALASSLVATPPLPAKRDRTPKKR